MVSTIFAILLVVITLFLLLDSTSMSPAGKKRLGKSTTIKEYINQYFDEFEMYLCVPHKVLLFPPKELVVRGIPFALNTNVKSDLLPYKRMIMRKPTTNKNKKCTECIYYCTLNSGNFVDLDISFNQFRKMTNEQFIDHLKTKLTSEQLLILFGDKYMD